MDTAILIFSSVIAVLGFGLGVIALILWDRTRKAFTREQEHSRVRWTAHMKVEKEAEQYWSEQVDALRAKLDKLEKASELNKLKPPVTSSQPWSVTKAELEGKPLPKRVRPRVVSETTEN